MKRKTIIASLLLNAVMVHATAQEKRFRDAVNAEVARIIENGRAETERQRAQIISDAQKNARSMAEDAKAATEAVTE